MTNNNIKEITEIYAFVAVNETGESILAMQKRGEDGDVTVQPVVSRHRDLIEIWRDTAIEASKELGRPVKLIKLTQREELETIEGGNNK